MSDPVPTIPSMNYFNPGGAVPQMTPGMTFSEIGNSGLRVAGGWIREEFLPQLLGRQGATTYREMGDNSPIVGSLLYAFNAVLRKVEWRVNPADDTPAAREMADFVESVMDDMSDSWEDVIAEALSMLQYGFSPMEIVYKRRLGYKSEGEIEASSRFDDGLIGWRKLPIRGQDTIIKWFFSPYGQVEGVTQQPYVGTLVDIPIQKLLLFRPSQHKGNPEGYSILRRAYRPYYMVKRLEEQEAILFERMNGVPVIKVPSTLMQLAQSNTSEGRLAAQTLETFKKIAINLRVDEQMGVLMPSDMWVDGTGKPTAGAPMYSLELVAPGGNSGRSSTAADPTITRHNNSILMSVLADFLSLGHGQHGTQALAVSKEDMFFYAAEGYLNSIAGVFNRHALPRLWRLNGFDPDLQPELSPDMARREDLDALSNFILRLSQSGMALFPNPDLETALLEGAGLPDIADAGAADLLPPEPVATVGPQAAAAMTQMLPQPQPEPAGSPSDNLRKMLNASIARRVMHRSGPRFPIRTTR